MIHHVRPWEIFKHLEGKDRHMHLVIPSVRGTESLTIMAVETQLLIAMARIVNVKSFLEIGTSMGYTALHLAMNTTAKVSTIDKEAKPCAFEDTRYKGAIDHIVRDVYDVKPFQNDMVFCDCNYSRELTLRCSELAFGCGPKVVAWHDYGNPEASHQKETLEILAQERDIYHIEDTWVCCWFKEGL